MNKVLFRVINCLVDKKRLTKFRKSALRANLPKITRVSCIDGRKYNHQKFCDLISEGKLYYKAELTPTQVAISLSHIKCWEQLVNSKADYMVVFEDDCHFFKSFMPKFEAVMGAKLNFDVFYLYNGNWGQTRSSLKKITTVDDIHIYKETKRYIASASAYIITKEWANFLLDRVYPIEIPIDDFMGATSVKKHNHFTVKNKRRKNGSWDCWDSSIFMHVPCPSDSNTTQSKEGVNTVDEKNLKHCVRSK